MQRKWRREWERHKGQATVQQADSGFSPLKTLARTMLPPVAAATMLLASMTMPAYANPTGGQVVSGAGSVAQSGNTMNITQNTNKMSINWQSFNIAANETVNFLQPSASSIALNRVVGNNASSIYGHLNANGQVFLINTNGILFAPGSAVNVGGLVASTLNLSGSDFQNGNYKFSGSGGSVINQGTITASNGGYVALLGGQVSNQGVIVANQGTVALGAGNAVTLDFYGDGLYSLAVNEAALNAATENKNLIQANGGLVLMTAREANTLAGTVVNNSGVIQAQSMNNVNGKIVLDGGTSGAVANNGTLDASGKVVGQTGGTVKVLGSDIMLASGTKIDVSGDAGGGTALVGGNAHGQGLEQNATTTTVANGATINADAITSGSGGKVVVWSDNATSFNGTISARGGNASGNGGFVETSGEKLTISDSARVTTLAANGKTGTWLLDPKDFTIGINGDMTGAYLSSQLASTDMEIKSVNGAGGTGGNIYVNDSVTWNANTLTLTAANNIYVNGPMTATGSAGFAGNYGSGINTDGTPMGLYIYQSTSTTDVASFAGKINFSGQSVTLNGTPYTVINDAASLAGIQSNGYYVMGSDFSTSAPITNFSGVFNGFGHTITVSAKGSGLFGTVGSGGLVYNFGVSASISPDPNDKNKTAVGALANVNNGTIINSFASGTVSAQNWSVPDATVQYLGGLVGDNAGTIAQCFAADSLYVTNVAGGLVGRNTGTIFDSSVRSYGSYGNPIQNAGSATSITYVGGFVGENDGTIKTSFAASNINLTDNYSTAGCFAGINNKIIEQCYVYNGTSSLSTYNKAHYLAGFVGENTATGEITNSYTTALKSTASTSRYEFWDAGFVYKNAGIIKNAYATSYSYNNASGARYGFAAQNTGSIEHAYWNSTNVTGNGTVYTKPSGGYATELDSTSVASYSSYSFDDPTSVWAASSSGYPILRNIPLYISASTTYGTDLTQSLPSVTGWGLQGGGGTTSGVDGNQSFAVNAAGYNRYLDYGYLDAGTYLIADMLSSSVYTNAKGILTVNKKTLTLPTADVVKDKDYDGTNTATVLLTTPALSGLVGNQTLNVTYNPTGTFTNVNASETSARTATLIYTASDGANGGKVSNYTIPTSSKAYIHKKQVTVTVSAGDKTYDGNAAATVSSSLSGLVPGQTLTLGYTSAAFSDANAGNDKTVTVSGLTLANGTGGNSANYVVASTTATTTADITPVVLTLTGAKAIDGSATVTGNNLCATNLVGADTVTFGGTAKLASANEGTVAIIDTSGLTVSNPNYTVVGSTGNVAIGGASLIKDKVVSGTVDIAVSGKDTTITASNKAVIDWLRFSVASDETLTFVQPDATAIVLNRVTTAQPSVIAGTLKANGRVFIINANGILFTATSKVDAGGLVASTLDMSNNDFAGGNYVFKAAVGSQGSVVAAGDIVIIDKGFLALVSGNGVTTSGNLTAPGGTAVLASANQLKLTLSTDGSGLASYAIQGPSGSTAVSGKVDVSSAGGNGGLIEIAGGSISPSISSIMASINTGTNGTLSWSLPTITIGDGGTFTGDYVTTNLLTRNMGFNALSGDLNLNVPITWATDRTLTLGAMNNVNINKTITVNGTNGGLSLNSGGDYNLLTKASYSGTVLDSSGNPIANQAPTGVTYSTIEMNGSNANLKINGRSYTLIRSLSDLDHIDGMDAVTGNYYNSASSAYDIPATTTVTTTTNGVTTIVTKYYNPATGHYDLDAYAHITGYYALTKNLDASGTTYASPVIAALNGTFTGLGHTISNLTINSGSQYVGLVGILGSSSAAGASAARDIGLENAQITSTCSDSGFIGAGVLAGVSYGNIKGAYSTGTVSATNILAGGLIGYEAGTASARVTVTDSYSTANVYGKGGLIGRADYADVRNSHAAGGYVRNNGGYVGGLLGSAYSVNVYNSYATNNVAGGVDANGASLGDTYLAAAWPVGGLIGGSNGDAATQSIVNSFATGNVTGFTFLGGLIGGISNSGSADYAITNCYATGNVTGKLTKTTGDFTSVMHGIGGLVGNYAGNYNNSNSLIITRSHATGNVAYADYFGSYAGGLVGAIDHKAQISDSYATGNVIGGINPESGCIGGLVGVVNSPTATIDNCYATGNVSGSRSVGGFIGANNGTITNSYATGNVNGKGRDAGVGGFVGTNTGQGSIYNSFATGSASGTDGATVGGFAGINGGIQDGTYYNKDTNNNGNGQNSGTVNGGGGLTGRQINNKDMQRAIIAGTVDQLRASWNATQNPVQHTSAATQDSVVKVDAALSNGLQNPTDRSNSGSLWQISEGDNLVVVDTGRGTARITSIRANGVEYQLEDSAPTGQGSDAKEEKQ